MSGIAAGDAEERVHARLSASRADALEALPDKHAIAVVEAHHVGYGAQRHQVQQGREVGRLPAGPAGRASLARVAAST